MEKMDCMHEEMVRVVKRIETRDILDWKYLRYIIISVLVLQSSVRGGARYVAAPIKCRKHIRLPPSILLPQPPPPPPPWTRIRLEQECSVHLV